MGFLYKYELMQDLPIYDIKYIRDNPRDETICKTKPCIHVQGTYHGVYDSNELYADVVELGTVQFFRLNR
jgi:hypothetical protein